MIDPKKLDTIISRLDIPYVHPANPSYGHKMQPHLLVDRAKKFAEDEKVPYDELVREMSEFSPAGKRIAAILSAHD